MSTRCHIHFVNGMYTFLNDIIVGLQSISPGLVQNTNIFKAGNFSRFTSQAVEDSPHLLPEDVSDGVIYVLSTKPNVQVCYYYFFY